MGCQKYTRHHAQTHVSRTGTTTYEVAQQGDRFLRPLVGKPLHHIKNTKDFVDQIDNIQLQKGEYISS